MQPPQPQKEHQWLQYKDVIEFLSDDHRVLSSQLLGEDGTWLKFMTAHCRRKK